ncbi:MAG TPA: phosphatidylglycerol lysyltransferase domain-containing protein [Ktedonobacterales bacterium]
MGVATAAGLAKHRHVPLSWSRFLVGLIVGLTGFASMLTVFAPRLGLDRWLDVSPLDFDFESEMRSLAVILGFLLIMLSRGLMRGKHHAWQLTLFLLAFSAIFHAVHGTLVLATWVAVLAIVLMSVLRPQFRARSDPPSVIRGYAALVSGLLLVFMYTIGGFLLLRAQFAPIVGLRAAARLALHAIAWSSIGRHIPITPQAQWFIDAVRWLSFSALVFGVAQVLRPVATALLPAPHEREVVKDLLRRWGNSTISFVALGHEKSYYFHSSGEAVLAYRLAGNVAVVAGDPIGPPALLPGLLQEFAAHCQQQDWPIVFWQVSHDLLPLYTARGFQALKIGEDAILDIPTFTLKGNAMQNVRSSARHAEKAGIQVRFFDGEVDDPHLARQMEAIAAAWLADKGGVEMGFSMGRFGEKLDVETVYAVAVDAESRVHAFVSFVPIYGRDGWSLDLMRRDATSASGTMELLLVRAVEQFGSRAARILCLGLAPKANTSGEPCSSIEQLCYFFTSRFGGLSRAASLYNFKRKFHPRWESRYLVYPSTLALPRVGLALAAAHLSRQWLPWARLSQRQKAEAIQTLSVPHAA